MGRKSSAGGQNSAASTEEPEPWSTEAICAAATVVFILAFAFAGQVMPRMMSSACTTEQGMCSPGPCTCAPHLTKRELITKEGLACSQCVSEFCPAVPEGDTACSTSACECSDPSWPRTNVGTESAPCWQCVHPPVDVTLRESSLTGAGCFVKSNESQGLQLAESWNSSSCIVFRFNGAIVAMKSQNETCLIWSEFGQYWRLGSCEEGAASFFKQHLASEENPGPELFCTGPAGEEFCVEPAEYMCTTDATQCSTGPCRCDDPTHVRKEMQTVNRTPCSLCAPPLPSCPISPEPCAEGPCECRQDGFVKIRHAGSASGEQGGCFSCRSSASVPASTGGMNALASYLSTAATFILCVAIGVAVGCGIRHFWALDAPASPSRGRQRGKHSTTPSTWSERLAFKLQNTFEEVYNAAPGLRKVWKLLYRAWSALCGVLDACDEALEPCYQVIDIIFAKFQDAMAWISQQVQALFSTPNATPADGKRQHSTRKADRGAGRPHSKSQVQWAPGQMTEQDLLWDPLSKHSQEDKETSFLPNPKESRAMPAGSSKPAFGSSSSASSTHERALRKLQKRKEAQAAAESSRHEQTPEEAAPVDESWIDDLERKQAKEKEAKEKAALQRRERKTAMKAARRTKQSGGNNDEEAASAGPAEETSALDQEPVSSLQEEDEQEAAQTSETATTEDLLNLVGVEDSGAMLETDLLLSEAMHGLFLLTSESQSGTQETAAEDQENDAEEAVPQKNDQRRGNKREQRRRRKELLEESRDAEAAESPTVQEAQTAEPADAEEAAGVEAEEEIGQPPVVEEQEADLETQAPTKEPTQEGPEQLSKRQLQRRRQRAALESRSHIEKLQEEQQKQKEAMQLPPHSGQKQMHQGQLAKGKAEAASLPEKLLPRAFADVVAGRSLGKKARRPDGPPSSDDEPESEAAIVESKPLTADAPEFVPMSIQSSAGEVTATAYLAAMPPAEASSSSRGGRQGQRKGGRKEAVKDETQALPLTTVMIVNIPEHHTAETFRQQIDSWGLMGTYDFFYMPLEREEGMGACAYVNFVDASLAVFCQQLFLQVQVEGTVVLSAVQGLENNVSHWAQAVSHADLINGPLVIPSVTAAQWPAEALNDLLLMGKFAPQIRDQFHKTKLCVFNRKQKCALGSACPFAHSKEELQAVPDLKKTKLCINFYRKKCNDKNCKFAHGYSELRSTQTVFKTELCRWYASGGCKAGDSCRYAHGVDDLRGNPLMSAGMPFASLPEGSEFENHESLFGGLDMQADADTLAYWEAIGMMSPNSVMGQVELGQPILDDATQGEFQAQDRSDTTPSDMGVSDDASTFFGGQTEARIQRQQTAPPRAAFSCDQEAAAEDPGVMLRIKGTFVEAVCLEEEDWPAPLRRSWSDGDLPQLFEAMESESEAESR